MCYTNQGQAGAYLTKQGVNVAIREAVAEFYGDYRVSGPGPSETDLMLLIADVQKKLFPASCGAKT